MYEEMYKTYKNECNNQKIEIFNLKDQISRLSDLIDIQTRFIGVLCNEKPKNGDNFMNQERINTMVEWLNWSSNKIEEQDKEIKLLKEEIKQLKRNKNVK